MAIRNLTRFDDELFRKKSKPVVKFDERLWTLLDDMRDTLEHVNGYGCAAVHVGILRRAIVVNDKNGLIEVLNPVIAQTSEETARVLEGSIAPGAPRGYVERPVNTNPKLNTVKASRKIAGFNAFFGEA